MRIPSATRPPHAGPKSSSSSFLVTKRPPYAAVTGASGSCKTRQTGYAPNITTYAMLYNRYAWLFYSTLLLLVFLRPTNRSNHVNRVADGILLGALLGLLLYCKITFFIVGSVAVVLGLIVSSLPWSVSLALSTAFGFRD
jgi:hypothetical protein